MAFIKVRIVFLYMKQKFYCKQEFKLEYAETLHQLEIAYCTYGTLNKKKNNVVWIFHALTANADAADWWSGLIGKQKYFDTDNYFIVCANILGSCYGTTGPLSKNKNGECYYNSFPYITIRDMVNAHKLLKKHLGIEKIFFGAGGSMGAYQLMEWMIQEPELFDNALLLATSPAESAWGKAIHTAQRMAIEADYTFKEKRTDAGKAGLKAARAIGMLTYRNYHLFKQQQHDDVNEQNKNYKAESYIRYQGEKLANRFNAHSYYVLTQAMDSHNIFRNRKDIQSWLAKIKTKSLVIGISSDILCPVEEQKYLSKLLPNAIYAEIDSPYGHDGFLIESEKIEQVLKNTFI